MKRLLYRFMIVVVRGARGIQNSAARIQESVVSSNDVMYSD
jgi:hypothetical protein